MSIVNYLTVFGLIVVLSVGLFDLTNALCDQRAFGGEMVCCEGRNSSCFVNVRDPKTGKPINGRKYCYCDDYCKTTRDCCSDYSTMRKLCQGSRDCVVSGWTAWSKCSADCGVGVMRRKRIVTELPVNGGKPCPGLRQVRGCSLNQCPNKIETALILPEAYRRVPFGSWGYENILPAHENEAEKPQVTESYCVNFKLMFKRHSCARTWASKLESRSPVCVECQSRVSGESGHCRGEGEMGIRTRWKALGLHRCHGDWIRLGPIISNCTCTKNIFSNFVFV